MITPKAYQKLMNTNLTKDAVQKVATIIAASNVLIADITKDGKLVLEHLKN